MYEPLPTSSSIRALEVMAMPEQLRDVDVPIECNTWLNLLATLTTVLYLC